MSRKISAVAAAMLSSTVIAPHALARPLADQAAGTEISKADIGDIIVTARRRSERLQDVPVAISVVEGAELQRQSIVRAEDLPRAAPGMVVTTSVYGGSNLTIGIRSQRQQLNNGTYDASVGVYLDEVPQARTQGLNGALYDIASVQVLKGPQGTLFGRNTTGGAVLITSAPPTDRLEGYAQIGLGNFGARDMEAVLNLPVSDSLQLRFSGKYSAHDGYFYSTTEGRRIGDLDTRAWRFSARWQPTDNLTNLLVVNGFDERDDGTVFKLAAVNPLGAGAIYRDQMTQFTLLQNSAFWTTTASVVPGGTDVNTLSVSNITTLEAGAVTLKNIFGYRRVRSAIGFNIDGDQYNSYFINTLDSGHQYSDELNLSGKAMDGKLEYFAGLFFFKEDNASSQRTQNRMSVPFTSAQPGVIANTIADPITNTSYSAYAQATYHFGESGISLTGGARYTYDKREVAWRSAFLAPTTNCRLVDANGVALSPCVREGSISYRRPTWTATLDWKASADLLLYGTYRRGYRSGGFTLTAYNPFEAQPYAPETVDDFEIGAKGTLRFDGGRFTYALAGYYDKYNDIQRQLTDNSKPIVSVFFVNAAKATIKGVEANGTLDYGRLTLSGSFSYSDAQYKRFFAPGPGGRIFDYSRAPFAGAPKYTVTWLARYALIDSERTGRVSIQGSGYYQSDTVAQDVTSFDPITETVRPQTVLHSRHVIDGMLEWANVMGGAVDLQLYVRNLTKARYLTQINDALASTSFGQTEAIMGNPRTYGGSLKIRF
ncbi:TonB-dependent receptor [Sphingobium sp. Sx8-8]|uniref:TonB-dependent receptor n=1 Tax=Sphingobium sp. Sx8-8 TaxID=2933617 RepID=UPI001F55C8C8|nr:TonB-dependent receptor [Sphingobium sp. Sx8-8]